MDNIEDSITPSKLLHAIISAAGEIRVPVLKLLEDDGTEKGFIMEYDETDSSFVFRI
jgi:hypothetical protein